jgi:branched-chain amino acid aminotransferase
MALDLDKSKNSCIWFNGEIIDAKSTKVGVCSHSLHYSGAVFEGERAYDGVVFKLEEHIERLLLSAKAMHLKIPYLFSDIERAHQDLLQTNSVCDAYVRPIIWRGSESLNITNKKLSVNLAIIQIPTVTRKKEADRLHLSKLQKPHPNALPPQVKSSTHYGMAIIAKEEALSSGYDDALIRDWRGYVAECTTSNIFFVKDDVLETPIADAFLNGITRQTVIEIALKLGLRVQEKHIEINDLQSYSECFTTGTAAEIRGVKAITTPNFEHNFDRSKVTVMLQSEYMSLVRRKK